MSQQLVVVSTQSQNYINFYDTIIIRVLKPSNVASTLGGSTSTKTRKNNAPSFPQRFLFQFASLDDQ